MGARVTAWLVSLLLVVGTVGGAAAMIAAAEGSERPPSGGGESTVPRVARQPGVLRETRRTRSFVCKIRS